MKKRGSRRRDKRHIRAVHNRATLIALCLIVTLVGGGAILAGGKGGWFATKSLTPSPQGNPISPGNPSKEYIYAGGRLLATEEPISAGCAPISAPVLTTSVQGSVITLSWTVPSGAATFDVERAPTKSGPFAPLATNLPLTTTTFPDNSVFFSGVNLDGSNNIQTYIYRVVARNGSCSQASNMDWGTNITFAESLIPQQTLIKAHHMTELRVAVNSVWKAAEQIPATITWTDPPAGTPQGLTQFLIKKLHVDQLRSKLNQAMDAIQPGYSAAHPYDETITQFSTPVRASHLIELRARVK